MKHRPRRRFGQNFLVDPNVLARIIAAIRPQAGEHILEIGPGPGALTRPLLNSGARVSAIEIDRDLAAALRDAHGGEPRFALIEADALTVDFSTLAPQPLRVVGNLPYNISTPLLFHVLTGAATVTDMHFMLQKEVIDRIVARPGTRDYGRLSVAVALRCDAHRVLAVPPGAFRPPPRVDSAVVRLVPRADPGRRWSDDSLDRVLRGAFAARRKTLRNALRGLVDSEALAALDINPGLRPERLEPEDFARIAAHIDGR